MSELHELILAGVVVLIMVALTPSLAKRIGTPVIVIELIIGIIIGRSFLDLIPEHDLISFFTTFGIVYIMFLAGLEVDLREVKKYLSETAAIALASISVPFVAGVLITPFIGLDLWPEGLLIGTVFSTTSLGLVLPLSRELGFRHKFSHVLLGSVILVDILSMFILAFSLSYIEGDFGITFVVYFLLALVLFIIPWLIRNTGSANRLEAWIMEESHFETGVRFSFALMAVFTLVSLSLGFHAIIGAFVAGLIISELTPQRDALCEQKSLLEHKLESFGYGFFIPIFFIFVGANTNVPKLFVSWVSVLVLIVIILAGIISKVMSVTAVSIAKGFNGKEGLAMGFMHCARLSLIIAAVEIMRTAGLIDETLYSAFIMLALVSAIVGPIVGKRLMGRRIRPDPRTCKEEDYMYGV